MIRVHGLEVKLGKRAVLSGLDFAIPARALIGVAGPNGAGKSTLLRALAGLLKPASGEVRLDGTKITSLAPAQRAARVAWLPQHRPLAWRLNCEDVAALGVVPGGATTFARATPAQRSAIEAAMAETGASALIGRRMETLSGGEAARVHLARVLVSPAPILVLDEPATALDIAHQLDLMALLRAQTANGRTVIAAAHDLDSLSAFCSAVLVLDQGKIAAYGPPSGALGTDVLQSVFGVRKSGAGRFEKSDA